MCGFDVRARYPADGWALAGQTQGHSEGRYKALADHQLTAAEQRLDAPKVNMQGVAENFGVSRSTLYRLLVTTLDEVADGAG